MRREHPVFRRRRFFHGRPIRGSEDGVSDIAWFRPDGKVMSGGDWDDWNAKAVGVFLNGDAISEPDERGAKVHDETFLLLFNASHEDLKFTIPDSAYGSAWDTVLDSAAPLVDDQPPVKAGGTLAIEERSLLVLRRAR
jgi:glycogen operon protein